MVHDLRLCHFPVYSAATIQYDFFRNILYFVYAEDTKTYCFRSLTYEPAAQHGVSYQEGQ